MDGRQIGFKLTLDALGLDGAVETFDDRLIVQKAMYLAQAAGVDHGYFYRWYLRGPYCPAVADDAFAVALEAEQGVDDAQGWELDEASLAKLSGIREWMGREDLASWLELLASVHFLIDRKKVTDDNPGAIREVLLRFEKQYSEEQVVGALEELRGRELLS